MGTHVRIIDFKILKKRKRKKSRDITLPAKVHLVRKGKSPSHVQLFVTLWTVAYQASQSMGFSRQEYWSGLPFKAMIFPVVMYGYESWTVRKAEH